jgi:hypothetical protein
MCRAAIIWGAAGERPPQRPGLVRIGSVRHCPQHSNPKFLYMRLFEGLSEVWSFEMLFGLILGLHPGVCY